MTISQYGSMLFTGSNPSKVPDGIGDLYLEQDRVRDFAWVWDRVGAVVADILSGGSNTPILLWGGVVTAHSGNASLDISAGAGYAPYTIDLGSDNVDPPATQAEDITMVQVKWGAQSAVGTFGSGTYYVKMKYAETDGLVRQRARASGTWYFTKVPSYTLTITTVAPTAYEILLATVTASGGTVTHIQQASYPYASAEQWDLVINSNATLDLWCQAVAGQYKRVYIKSGTWTASALSPTAGVLVNLDAAGTVFVFAEKGSSINYSGSVSGNLYGLKHANVATDMNAEKFENVTVNITNTHNSSYAQAFYKCTNLVNCSASGIESGTNGTGRGFDSCVNLTDCIGDGEGTGTGQPTGFENCTMLKMCIGTGINSGNYPGAGFHYCTTLIACTGTGTNTGTGSGSGFENCNILSLCIGIGNGSASSDGWGFIDCVGVSMCAGQGLGPTAGYGFGGCTKMQQNKPYGVSKTGTYSNCFADSGSSHAAADTADGGYNS